MITFNRMFFILFGLILIMLGAQIISNPSFFHRGHLIDYTRIKWYVGFILMALGILFMWSSLRPKADVSYKDLKDQNKVMMCLKCNQPIVKKDAPDLKCTRCGFEIEELEGFYDRHPELRE